MTLTVILLLLLYASSPLEVNGFPSGASPAACSSLSPQTGHGSPPQAIETLPYTLDLSSLNTSGVLEYVPGTTYSSKRINT